MIIATGDTEQLKPIETITNQCYYKFDLNFCADQIVPNQIFLEDIKRIKDPKQKQRAKRISDKILISRSSEELEQIKKKYFKYTKHITHDDNVAYRNTTCKSVSTSVRKKK